jgi:hypothetical protein
MPSASAFLFTAFFAFAVAVAAGVVWNVYLGGRGRHEPRALTIQWTTATAIGMAIWMALTWYVAASGALADFDRRPPPMLLLFAAVVTLSVTLSFSRFGSRFVEGLPLWLLILGQAFRLPLELLMHRAADEGVMPAQMSYSGWNFDIVTGVTALPVAWLLARGVRHSRALALAWNVLGSVLLANIVTIAMLSTPLVAAFGRDRLNIWVAHPPFVWLPTVMVVCALTGHLVIFRKLKASR